MGITISDAQMTALETAGLFEAPEGEEGILAAAIAGNRLHVDADNAGRIARIICELSNGCDDMAEYGDVQGEAIVWARRDSRALSNLYIKVIKEARSAQPAGGRKS